jgi:hypothetical protein
MDLITTLISVVASMLSYILVDYVAKLFFKKKKFLQEGYNVKLKQLTNNLVVASREVDKILLELTNYIESKEKHLTSLESELSKMSNKEIDLKQKIETLQNTPIVVADHFAKLVEQGEKRSKQRDYLLFGAGVLVTTIISLLFKI